MDTHETMIIRRRKGKLFQCPFCMQFYPRNMQRCPFCFGEEYYKYYFNKDTKEPQMNEISRIICDLRIMLEKQIEIKRNCEDIIGLISYMKGEDILNLGNYLKKENLVTAQKVSNKISSMLYPKMDEKLSDSLDPWITTANFAYHTKICSASWLGQLFNSDKNFYFLCGLKRGKRWYIKKEAAINYFKEFGEGKVFKNTLKYLKQRDDQCQKNTYVNAHAKQQSLPTKPLS